MPFFLPCFHDRERYTYIQFVENDEVEDDIHVSRMLRDPELLYFTRELQHTPAGRRYRKAWNEMAQAAAFINTKPTDLHGARLRYIDACQTCTIALDALHALYNWPEAPMDLEFQFTPARRFRR